MTAKALSPEEVEALLRRLEMCADDDAGPLLRAHTAALEADRDEARRMYGDLIVKASVHTAALLEKQRAELATANTESAALLGAIRMMRNDDTWGSERPGAALLERVRRRARNEGRAEAAAITEHASHSVTAAAPDIGALGEALAPAISRGFAELAGHIIALMEPEQ